MELIIAFFYHALFSSFLVSMVECVDLTLYGIVCVRVFEEFNS